MEAQFSKTLSARLDTLVKKLGITIPEGGYVINLYEKSHLAALQKDAPQNITKYLKGGAYEAKRGEIIAQLDSNDPEKMIQGILQQLLKNQFGINWAQIDAEND